MKQGVILLIGVMVLVSISLLVQAQQDNRVCCAETTAGDFCSFTTPESCKPNPAQNIGFITSPFACSQLSDCQQVCCINKDGVCSEKISKAQCRAKGGRPVNSPDCNIAECSQGACIISNQCQFPVTAEACKLKAEDLGVRFTFDIDITTLEECNTKYSLQEGCCVLPNQCSRLTGESCTLQKGTFHPGKLCSTSDLVGECRGQTAHFTKTCYNGDVYWQDSKGQLENIVKDFDKSNDVPDGLIHEQASELQSYAGNCNLAQGTACGKDESGQLACISVDCIQADIIDLRGINQYEPATAKVFPVQHRVTSQDLGGKAIRKNGESWCTSTATQTPPEPGSSQYVYSCILGKIIPTACGAFRDQVCEQGTTTQAGQEISAAKCVDNRWEDCWLKGRDTNFRSANAFYLENKVNPSRDDLIGEGDLESPRPGSTIRADTSKPECLLLGGSLNEEQSHCVWDTNKNNECWPKYPPGFEFWKPVSADEMNEQRLCENNVRCGAGGTNSCDRNECTHIGDCGNFEEGLNMWEGGLIGAGIGFASGVGANHLFSAGTGGGWLGGELTVKEAAEASLIKAGLLEKGAFKGFTDIQALGAAKIKLAAAGYSTEGLTQVSQVPLILSAGKGVSVPLAGVVAAPPAKSSIAIFGKQVFQGILVGQATQVVNNLALKPLLSNGQPYKTADGYEVYRDENGNTYFNQDENIYNIDEEGKEIEDLNKVEDTKPPKKEEPEF